MSEDVEHPAVAKRADEAAAHLEGRDGNALACHHVAGGKSAMACSAHPAAGLMCFSCYMIHGRRHAGSTRWVCGPCEAEHRPNTPAMATRRITAVVDTTDGPVELVDRPVCIFCVGMCVVCRTELPEPA